jgi:hypothetical protein
MVVEIPLSSTIARIYFPCSAPHGITLRCVSATCTREDGVGAVLHHSWIPKR